MYFELNRKVSFYFVKFWILLIKLYVKVCIISKFIYELYICKVSYYVIWINKKKKFFVYIFGFYKYWVWR